MDARLDQASFLLVGVGGQGTILASDVLAEVGIISGYDVKKAEIHGMSQRGGSVVSHLRWGAQVFAPVIARTEADFLIAFEKLEAARLEGCRVIAVKRPDHGYHGVFESTADLIAAVRKEFPDSALCPVHSPCRSGGVTQ